MTSKIYDWWMRSRFTKPEVSVRYKLREWNKANIYPSASAITDILFGFEHIVEVDYYKVFEDYRQPNGVRIIDNFTESFYYPHRDLGDHAHVMIIRGEDTNDERIFERNEFGRDATFIGTNNEYDAVYFALKFK